MSSRSAARPERVLMYLAIADAGMVTLPSTTTSTSGSVMVSDVGSGSSKGEAGSSGNGPGGGTKGEVRGSWPYTGEISKPAVRRPKLAKVATKVSQRFRRKAGRTFGCAAV